MVKRPLRGVTFLHEEKKQRIETIKYCIVSFIFGASITLGGFYLADSEIQKRNEAVGINQKQVN